MSMSTKVMIHFRVAGIVHEATLSRNTGDFVYLTCERRNLTRPVRMGVSVAPDVPVDCMSCLVAIARQGNK